MPIKSYAVVKLKLQSPIHLSTGALDYAQGFDILHSDTLKSALFVAARNLENGQIDGDFFDQFNISSAFPYFRDEYFFPKPFTALPFTDAEVKPDEAAKLTKKQNKIQFLGQSFFEALLLCQKKVLQASNYLQGGVFVSEKINSSSTDKEVFIFKEEIRQHVHIHHYREPGRPTDTFYMERKHFHPEAGLFALIEAEDAVLEKLKVVFRLLGDMGVGNDKSNGNGQFIPEWDTLTLNVPEPTSSFMNLSLFCPSQSEINRISLDQSSYQLVKRGGGYLASPEKSEHQRFRKRSIYMLSEGSVLRTDEIPKGKFVDLEPQKENGGLLGHPVWRDGRSVFIPISQTT